MYKDACKFLEQINEEVKDGNYSAGTANVALAALYQRVLELEKVTGKKEKVYGKKDQ
jgi:hypothetical protein